MVAATAAHAMNFLKSYLWLPDEISDFERHYLARLNRIALALFVCHVPLMIAVALAAGTGVLEAFLLSSLAVVAPLLAHRHLSNPRHMGLVFAFTGACMGGLLVHVGRGPMQIEMNFYFFILITLLAVFANPVAILAAAATVLGHRLILYFVLPRSVFTYDASPWALGVHAVFIALETAAACFVARSFFDNVIGRERAIQLRTAELSERNRDMRLVLDNVGQGFLTLNLDGSLSPERSAVVDRWLGPYVPGKRFWDYVALSDPNLASLFPLAWEAVLEDVLPIDMAISQLPKRWTAAGKIFSLEYRPVRAGDKIDKVLMVASDVTAQIEKERFESEQRDFLRVLEHVLKDRKAFLAFYSEASQIVASIVGHNESVSVVRRHVHTLKGNCALFGLSRLANFCHEIESSMMDRGADLTVSERERLAALWDSFASNLPMLLGHGQWDRVEVDRQEYAAVIKALDGHTPREEISARIRSWEFETAEKILSRLAEQARSIAGRLGKLPPEVVIEPNGLRLLPERWSEFWSNFTHVVRNAVDHGIETMDERIAAGKPSRGRIVLTTRLVNEDLFIEISDDGRGISWDLIRKNAAAVGLPHESRADLIEALFHDGVTTKAEVSEFSGRGIGMGAVRAVCEKMGGVVEVTATPGRGTTVRCKWAKARQRVGTPVIEPQMMGIR
jgi:two-component system chemotaxis sensor kinase CheA